MKKLVFIFSVCMTVIFFTRTMGQAPKSTDITVFFVDRYMHCLIPVNDSIPISKPIDEPVGSIFSISISVQQRATKYFPEGVRLTVADKIRPSTGRLMRHFTFPRLGIWTCFSSAMRMFILHL